MATHNVLGNTGEETAVVYLENRGYKILHRNWRKGHLELDIVATDGKELVVIEVKTRRNTRFAQPYEAVNQQKIRNIVVATNAYIKMHCIDNPVRFDIMTIVGDKENFYIEHIKEAFFPPMW